MAFQ